MTRIEYDEIIESLNGLIVKPMKTKTDKAFNNGVKSAIHAIETYRHSNNGYSGGMMPSRCNWDGGIDNMERIAEIVAAIYTEYRQQKSLFEDGSDET